MPFVHLKQITDAKINRAAGNGLAQRKKSEHVVNPYPDVTVNEPLKVTETKDAWYYSALVLNEIDSNGFEDEFIGGEDADLNLVIGYVQLGVSKKSIYASQKNIFIKNASVSLIVGLLLLSFLYIVLRNITRPLEKLSAEGKLVSFKHLGFWKPMDTMREKQELESAWQGVKAPWKVWND